jgi:UDP-N-acetylglucosamine--N-acetylmuramyl-(pentapeptide) pyrophosphoryl-undecaprenol N-acetylglucosamine transferase
MENRLVPAQGIALDTVGFMGLRGKGALGLLRGSLQLLRAFFECASILRARQADAVLGMGGYVCLPGGLVAWLQRRPLLLVNADAALLLSNRLLLRFAQRVAFGFAGAAARQVPHAVVTGNPVRAEIEALAPPQQRFAGRSGPLRLLVVGGSLGAQVLNQTVPGALALMQVQQRPLVTHQTGAAQLEAVRAAYAQAGVVAEVLPFIERIDLALADCDLLLSRAGAITVSEVCAAGVASVLVPLVIRTTSHQRDNAQWLADADAAIHLPQAELTPARLATLLGSLQRAGLQAMAERARALALPMAAQRVADEIEGLLVRPQVQAST